MEYTIGQVSRLLGLSIEGIRNYEKGGIIHSRRTEGSNYRKYGYLDITSLVRARMYRALGCSIQETDRLTNDCTVGEVCDFLDGRRAGLEREARVAVQKLRRMEELIAGLRGLEGELGRVVLCESPAVFRMEFSKNGAVDFSQSVVTAFQAWMQCAPFVYISSRYRGGEVYGGLAIDASYAGLFDIAEGDAVRFYPSTLCARLTVMEAENAYSDAGILEPIRAYAERHRFRLDGDMIGHTLIGIDKANGYKRCRRIYVPIAEV